MTGKRCDTVWKIFRKEEKTVKNKMLFISLAVVLAASLAVGAIGCGGGTTGPTPSDKIVMGMSRSLTGEFETIHESAFGAIYPSYITMINGAGGIDVQGTKFLLDTKIYNDNSEDAKVTAYTEALVNDIAAGDAHTLFGSDCTHYIDVQAPIANSAGVVLVTVEGGATFLKNPGYLPEWPYVFITLSFSDWYQLPVLAPMLSAEGASTAYIFWRGDAHGQEYMAAAEKYFPTGGLSIVGNQSILAGEFNPATAIVAANATGADVVCIFAYPQEIFPLCGTAISLCYNPNALVVGPGGCFGFFGIGTGGLGAQAEGVISFATANNATDTDAVDGMNWLFNTFLAGGVAEGQDFWGEPLYYSALQIWQHAVEQVGQVTTDGKFLIDQDDLKNELASYNSNTAGHYVETVLGPTWYTMFGTGGGIIAYQCHTGEIGQWQSGYMEIIAGTQCVNPAGTALEPLANQLPNYVTTDTLDYPKTHWLGCP
jgi:ABC-type branched-subunit amino acid transport system substrate-binding protein